MGLTGATLQSILESVVCIVAGIVLSVCFGWKVGSKRLFRKHFTEFFLSGSVAGFVSLATTLH